MSTVFETELRTPEDIINGLDRNLLTRPGLKEAIERYGDRRAMEAREEIIKQMGIPLKKEVEESLHRVSKMIDELFDKTISTMKDIKKGLPKK